MHASTSRAVSCPRRTTAGVAGSVGLRAPSLICSLAGVVSRHNTAKHPKTQTPARRVSRSLTVAVRADASPPNADHNSSGGDEHPLYVPATPSTFYPFSVELLLATTRLGHLERYREEVQQLFEPGMPVDLTRMALLVSNIYQPQLDHRIYFEALEHLVAAVTLAVMRKVSAAAAGAHSTAAALDSCTYFEGLDVTDPQHVLAAVLATNEVLFEAEGLGINTADPYNPLNGSLADLMDSHKGNQWSLAVLYLHILDALGLPCAVVGSPERAFIRVGEPPVILHHTSSSGNANSSSSGSGRPAALFVDMSQPGVVYAYPTPPALGSIGTLMTADSLASSSSGDSSSSAMRADDDWNRALHAFLAEHRQGGDGSAAADSGHPGVSSSSSSSSACNQHDAAAEHPGVSSPSSSRAEEFMEEGGEPGASPWWELEAYSTQDAASRNSWKALYGPGALSEWGGSVSRTWSSFVDSSGSSGGSNSGSMKAAEWLGLDDSPFAAAAREPFPGAAAEDITSSSSFSSMDTSCGSASVSLEEVDARDGPSSSSSSSNSTSGADGEHDAAAADGVLCLSWADVTSLGGLQPISKRLLLQQMLAGMKLSLMMSGRQDELVLVLRYLRATDPFSLPDLRDMGLCLADSKPEEAAPLLREYLAVAPGAPDADMVGEVLAQVELRVALGRSRGWK